MKAKILRFLATVALTALLAPLPSLAEGAAPMAVVETLHAGLLETMKQAEELGYKERCQRLDPVLGQTFDLDFMARKTVGRHWKELDEAEQQRWAEAFERFMTANYAGRFRGYSGESFETLGEEPATHQTMVVRTRLHVPSGDDVSLNYRLHETDQGWRIIDVYLDGTVSELALRRSEYSSVLKREGFAELVSLIDERTSDLAAGKSD